MPEFTRPISLMDGRFVQQTAGILFKLQATDYMHQRAAQSETRDFDNPNTRIVGSNFTWGMDVCPYIFCFNHRRTCYGSIPRLKSRTKCWVLAGCPKYAWSQQLIMKWHMPERRVRKSLIKVKIHKIRYAVWYKLSDIVSYADFAVWNAKMIFQLYILYEIRYIWYINLQMEFRTLWYLEITNATEDESTRGHKCHMCYP
jgi:hypothetical protein